MTKVLLGHLTSNGDCLYATTIARQIKEDFPGCHLTWAISSKCRNVIDNNPHVDRVWEVPLRGWEEMNPVWSAFETEAWRRLADGEYNHAFMTQICPNYFCNYDGTIRPSIFRNYPNPITVPVETVIALTDDETERVENWAKENRLSERGKVVLFECSSKSGQSFLTPELAIQTAELVTQKQSDVCFIISTHEEVNSASPQILSGRELTLRETSHLTHHCDLFVGCGSGVTVVATSGAAKPELPNIQVLNRSNSVYASFKHDFEYFQKPAGHFLETTTGSVETLAKIIGDATGKGFESAQSRWGEKMPLDFGWYFTLIDQMLLQKRRYIEAAQSLCRTAERYGWTGQLKNFGRAHVLPLVDLDPRLLVASQFNYASELREALA